MRGLDPTRLQGAIAVDELDVVRRVFRQGRQSGVAGARGGERHAHIERDDLRPEVLRGFGTAVG